MFILIYRKNLFFNLFFLCTATELFIGMGSFFSIGENEIPLSWFSEYILIIYILFKFSHISSKYRKCWYVLSIGYLLPILILYLFPSDVLVAAGSNTWDEIMFENSLPDHPKVTSHGLKQTIKYLLFALVIIYIYTNWQQKDYVKFMKRIVKVCHAYIYLGVFEFVCKNIMGLNKLWGEVMLGFWGETESTIFEGRERGGLFELNMFTRETSHYAYLLFIICLILLSYNYLKRKKNLIDLPIIIALILMIISTSFSVVLFFPGFFAVFFLHRWYVVKPHNAKYEKIYLSVFCFLILSYLTIILTLGNDSFVGQRLDILYTKWDLLLSSDWRGISIGDGSTQVRIVSIIQTILAFVERPLFGFSLTTVNSHGSTATFLASVGLIGFVCWIYYFFIIHPFQNSKRLRFVYIFAIILYAITNLFNSFHLHPYVDLSVFIIATTFASLFCQSSCPYITKGIDK